MENDYLSLGKRLDAGVRNSEMFAQFAADFEELLSLPYMDDYCPFEDNMGYMTMKTVADAFVIYCKSDENFEWPDSGAVEEIAIQAMARRMIGILDSVVPPLTNYTARPADDEEDDRAEIGVFVDWDQYDKLKDDGILVELDDPDDMDDNELMAEYREGGAKFLAYIDGDGDTTLYSAAHYNIEWSTG